MAREFDWLRGCATALVTPFTRRGDLDEEGLARLVERQIEAGVRVLVACGTTGESATLTTGEFRRVVSVVTDAARGRARTLVGTGTNATHTTLERSLDAMRFGADGVLVVSPYYNKPGQEGLYRHFAAVCGALEELPVVFYNVPSRTASNVAASTLLRLARDFENAAGVKEASGNLSQLATLLRRRPGGFAVLGGDDALALASIALGADGLVSVVSNEAPELTRALVDAALAGDFATARRIHYRLLPLMEANFVETNPVPAKAALAMLGLIDDHCRLPLVAAGDETRETLRDALAEAGLLASDHIVESAEPMFA